jgi:hypothetical protein
LLRHDAPRNTRALAAVDGQIDPLEEQGFLGSSGDDIVRVVPQLEQIRRLVERRRLLLARRMAIRAVFLKNGQDLLLLSQAACAA